MSRLKKTFFLIIDFLFPPTCPICSEFVSEHGMLCAECWAKFNWIGDPKCACCGYPCPANLDLGPHPLCPVCASGENELDWLRSACVYDDVSRDIMLPFKHAAALRYQKIMSRAMINVLRELESEELRVKSLDKASLFTLNSSLSNFVDIVMPIPLAYRRLWHRGYNQAALLAAPIAKHFGVKMDTGSVRRKYRSDMGHMTGKQRAENIRGVFKVIDTDAVRGKTVLLVDDVMTTGATFHELRRVLKKAGAKAVYGVTFCRVVRAI
jgi:ComF family protein